jgi:hypothetical protein
MADWTRRAFDGIGVTQSPPGKHLSVLQDRYGGTVILCLDVSGSMYGVLHQAVDGARRFVAEALAARYRVGLILWHHGVQQYVAPQPRGDAVLATLAQAHANGGNDIVPTLEIGLRDLGPLAGDRVMAIFGDGDLGDQNRAIDKARELTARGIRIIVRGLGEHAAALLNAIATEGTESSLVTSGGDLSAGISSMAKAVTGIRRGGSG